MNKRFPLALPLTLFLIGGLIGLWAAYDRSLGLPTVCALWGGAFVYAVLVWWCQRVEQLRMVSGVLVACAALGTLLLFMQYRHLGFESKFGLSTMIGQITSAPFPHVLRIPFQQNAAASFLESAIPLACGLWLSSRGKRKHLWLGAALWICTGVVLTASRGALIALAGCALVAGIAWLAGRQPRSVLVGLGIGAVALIVGVLLFIAGATLHVGPIESFIARASDRLAIYRNVSFLLSDVFYTGVGAGNTFAMIYARYVLLIQVPYLTYSHNLFLSVWLAQGICGVIGLLLMSIEITRMAWYAGRSAIKPFWLGTTLGVFALLVHGLIDSPQYNADGWWTMISAWAYLGVAVAGLRLAIPVTEGQPTAPNPKPRRPRIAFAATLLVVLAILARPAIALGFVNMGAITEAQADLRPTLTPEERIAQIDSAKQWYQQALQLNPDQASALRHLGIRASNELHLAEAIKDLEHAWQIAPTNQTTRKALGYAYLWNGQVAEAVALFRNYERVAEIKQELETWAWWWGTQQRRDLANFAQAAAQKL